jgi:hypothetical protein
VLVPLPLLNSQASAAAQRIQKKFEALVLEARKIAELGKPKGPVVRNFRPVYA